jgi:hypothetical protein
MASFWYDSLVVDKTLKGHSSDTSRESRGNLAVAMFSDDVGVHRVGSHAVLLSYPSPEMGGMERCIRTGDAARQKTGLLPRRRKSSRRTRFDAISTMPPALWNETSVDQKGFNRPRMGLAEFGKSTPSMILNTRGSSVVIENTSSCQAPETQRRDSHMLSHRLPRLRI